jgi:hypothetical protein
MQVQVHADDSIQGGESLAQWAQEEINAKLARLKEYVVRGGLLTGVDALKTTGGPGKRCVLETRATTSSHCSERGSRKGQGGLQRRD